MQKKKKGWETLRDTGMLGAYRPEEVSLQELPSSELEDLMVAIASGAVDEKQLCSLLKLKARPVP